MGEVSDMSFWALTVPGKSKPSKYEVEQTGELAQYVHVTNVALPHDAPPGPHSLTITQGEHEYTIATLNKTTYPQHNLDFIPDQTIVFKNTGPGPLHLLGYQTVANVMDLHGDEEDSEFDEDEEDEDEDEEDEDEEAPNLVPVANGKPVKLSKEFLALLRNKPGPKLPAKVEEDDDDDDDDDDDHDDEDEDDEGDDDEDDTRGPTKGIPMHLGEDDIVMEFDSDVEDEGEDDEGEEEDEDDDDDEDEEEDDVPVQVPTKRPHPAIAATPAAKKSKGLEGVALAQAPKSAPPKSGQPKTKPDVPAGDQKPQAKPADAKEYEAAIVALLKSKPNKTVPLASLGTAVHRPEGVPKLGTFIKTKDKLFKLDKLGQNVTLIG